MGKRDRQLGLFEAKAKAKAQAGARSRRRTSEKGRAKPGRKVPRERRGFAKHEARPSHVARHPVHVTMRGVRLAPSFRSQLVYAAIYAEIAAAKSRKVRIVEHSIQDDHVHLMVEGEDSADLSKQMCRLFSRIAMAVNRVARRHGALFRDRHHRHALRTPTEVRNALVYILFNIRKHAATDYGATALRTVLDGFSSAPWFEHWHPYARPPPDLLAQARQHSEHGATSAPQTWLARTGWLRAGGPIRFDELPRAPR